VITTDRRGLGRRTPGNPYASDATYEVAVVLASNRRCWDLIERANVRSGDGKVDKDALRRLFQPALSTYGVMGVRLSEVDWSEVAAEFFVEPQCETQQELQEDRAALVSWSSQARADISATDTADTTDVTEAEASAQEVRRPIEPDVLSVLRSSEITDQGLCLPAQQLERKLYEKVDQVLKSVGGKWDRRLGQHRFGQEDLQALDVAISTGFYVDPKDYGFFQTPPDLVQRVISGVHLQPHHLVLEPSAGMGALADAAARIVGTDQVKVVEMLDRNRNVLLDKGYDLVGRDFLQMTPADIGSFDFIVMNPPFGREADVEHVVHAAQFLKDGGELVAIMSPSHTFRNTAKARTFRALLEESGEQIAQNGAGAFKSSGTSVNTVIVKLYADRLPQDFRHALADSAEAADSASSFERSRGG
jgi:predicted RNA methylase